MFNINAIRTLIIANSALIDKRVVKLPGPAISGKTTGTNVEEPDGPSFLKISTPKIISIEIIRITNAPATANDCRST
jgi:hypothetical protein